MRDYLDRLPDELKRLVRLSQEIALLRNMSVYLVGGFVRDLILRVDNFDMDIVVEGDGIMFAEDLASRLNARIIRHKRFGTATIVSGSGLVFGRHCLKIDIATARKEIYAQPAQLPEVSFGSLKDDLKRRDFTINALALGISGIDAGKLTDLFNGRSDLRDRKIRVLHDISFIDDPTRILRAVRFEQRFDFRIDPETLKYLKKALKAKMLDKVQPQRLRDELILLLKEKEPVRQIRRMRELGAIGFISPQLMLSRRTFCLLDSIVSEIGWFCRHHSLRRKLDTWLIYFMALIDSLSLKDTESLCRRFMFRKGEEVRILSFKKIGADFIRWLSDDKIKPSRIFNLLEPLSYEVILLLKAKYKDALFREHIEDFLDIYNDMKIGISGHDLRSMGILPGPHYQKIFSRVFKAKINGLVKTKEEEIGLIKKIKWME